MRGGSVDVDPPGGRGGQLQQPVADPIAVGLWVLGQQAAPDERLFSIACEPVRDRSDAVPPVSMVTDRLRSRL